MTELIGQGLTLNGRLADVDFRLSSGEMVAIVGPNGSGKTSLMRMLSGLQSPDSGVTRLDNRPIASLGTHERARAIAYLPQRTEVAWPISVSDMVALGRFAFGRSPAPTEDRNDPVILALAEVGATYLAHRSTAELSGGELALCALARIFVVDPPLLLLDEPVAALDPARQLATMALLRTKTDAGHGIAVVLHDINLAARYADRIVWMKDNRIVDQCRADPTAITRLMRTTFGVHCTVVADDGGQTCGLTVTHIV